MKVTMYKKGMTRQCQDYEVELLESAGWSQKDAKPAKEKKVEEAVVSIDETITLKPPAKSKGAAKETLDNAINKGEE